jgi:hypothetical protein
MSEFNFLQLSSTVAPPYISFTNPALNEKGDVAFEGFLSPDLPPLGIFAANSFQGNVENKTIIDNSAPFLSTGAFQPVFDPSINNRGVVSFIENETSLLTDENGAPILDETNQPIIQFDKTSIKVGDGEQEPVTLLESTDQSDVFAGADLNDRGAIVYVRGNLLNIPVDSAVTSSVNLLKDGKNIEIASTDGIFSSFDVSLDTLGGDGPITSLDISPSINQNNEVAFNAGLDAGGQGIFVADSQSVTEVANSQGEFDLFSYPDLNEEGTTAFLVQRDDGSRGIYTNSYGKTKLLVDDREIFSSINSEPALNNNGEVAFYAELDDGSSGIYVASELGVSLVASVGDEIAGDKIAELVIVQDGLNDSGQIAFQAQLENGNKAVFRADPVSQPSDDKDRLYGDVGNNYLDGKAGDDLIIGGDGNDTLTGGNGTDILRGGAGDDNLIGGIGQDSLFGGDGDDVFNLTLGCGADRIFDYENGKDKFSLGDNLEFSDLNISQQNGDTEISLGSTGEVLASLHEVDSQAIALEDFV